MGQPMRRSKVLLLALLLAGCQTFDTTLLDSTVTTGKKEIVVDTEVMKDCGLLKDLIYPAQFEDLLIVYSENVKIFVECKKQNEAKKKILQEYVITKKKDK